MSTQNHMYCTSPWFNDGFLHAFELGNFRTLKIENTDIAVAGVERRARFGLKVLQIGSHFGEGVLGTTNEFLQTVRLMSRHGVDAVSIISPYELEDLDAYRVPNSTGTILLKLARKDEELWSGIRKSFKGCINQGIKKGNSIRWNDPHELAEIESLYRQHVVFKGYDGLDWSIIDHLFHLTGSDLRLDLGLVRNPQGDPAAMAAILLCGATAYYFVGASNPGSLSFYPGHYMQWNAILRYNEMGYQRYDLGGATEDPNKETYKITKFKRGFGGDYVKFYTYEIPLSYSYSLYQKISRFVKKSFLKKML